VLVVIEGVELPESLPKVPTDSNGEASLHSFIVHLWKEESASAENQPSWRGHITPVPNGKRYYFTSIGEIPDLILAHLMLQK
jgi:hypothetical protein